MKIIFGKILKRILYLIGIPFLLMLLTVFGAWLKYHSVVSSQPTNYTEKVKPGYYGK